MKIFNFVDVLPQAHNLLVRRRFNFHFEMIPYSVTNLSYKKIKNFVLAGMNQFFLPSKPVGYPVIAQIEPTNFCNLSCPLCVTTSQNHSRSRGILQYENFTQFIDDIGDYLLLIVMWAWGEPFLNPHIFDMIKYAKSKNIVIHSSTNGNVPFDEEKAEKLIDSGLDSLIFAIDGASQESYGKYRKGGTLENVTSNIKTIVNTKKKRNSSVPRLIMRTVVMKHNENEIPLLRELAKDLSVDYFTLKTVNVTAARDKSHEVSYVPANRKYQRYEYEAAEFIRKHRPFQCVRPWKRITLDALGDIIPCEFDYKSVHSYGNIRNGKSANTTWKNDRAMSFRAGFNKGNNDYYLCIDCPYRNRVADDCVVERISLK